MLDRDKLRLGMVGGAVTWPVKKALDRISAVQVEVGAAERIATRFAEEAYDCALLPVLDAVRTSLATVIPGVGVVTEGAAGTDLIMARVPLSAVRRVAVGPGVGSLLALARIVLAECHGIQPEFVDTPLDHIDPAGWDAIVVTGDQAHTVPNPYDRAYDLIEDWAALTGLPYVHFLWTARFRAPLPELRAQLGKAYQECEALSLDTAHAVAEERGLEHAAVTDLLAQTRYRLGGLEMDAVRTFVQLAKKHHLCESDSALTFC